MFYTIHCVLLYLLILCRVKTGECDLLLILEEVHQVTNIQRLGLHLGLYISAIDKIQDQYKSPEQQKTRIIQYWLQRKDIIPDKQSCLPTWNGLADAVAKESTALSRAIRAKHCKTSSQELD